MTAAEYVYLAWDLRPDLTPPDPNPDHHLDAIAINFGGRCCGGGTWFSGGERERDYEFPGVALGTVALFADAVRAAFPNVRVRLGHEGGES